jgi:hypothetical protein
LKKYLIKAPVLCYYQPERPTQVEIDTADSVVVAVLSQLYKDEQWHPVAFYLAMMVPAERNYDIYDKEILAIIKALKEWRPELVGLQKKDCFEILLNHRVLEYFMITKALNTRQARWCKFLNKFHFLL